MKQKTKSPAPKDLRALKAVGVAGLQYGIFADRLRNATAASQNWMGSAAVKRLIDNTPPVLPVGTVVRLVREPQNLFDPLAIRLDEEETGLKIGYVPRSQNSTLARLMDAGFPLYGVVLQHNKGVPVEVQNRLTVAVYIERYKAVRK